MSFIIVREQNQLGNEQSVVKPDPKHKTDTQPAHWVHHKVQAKLHGSRRLSEKKSFRESAYLTSQRGLKQIPVSTF